MTVAEIEAGIALAMQRLTHRKARALTDWLDALLHLYRSRVLAFDLPIARAAGRLSGLARKTGAAPGFADSAIAATAACHQLTILTRNVKHFRPLGVLVIDPFRGIPK